MPDSVTRTSRLFAAAPAEVFAAWTDAVRLARWWGPNGFTSTIHEFDPRPGGRWRFVMHGPNGADYPNESAFVEVLPAERIVLDHLSLPNFRLTARFDEEAGGTRLTWEMAFAAAGELEKMRKFIAGANEENLDRLGAELARRS